MESVLAWAKRAWQWLKRDWERSSVLAKITGTTLYELSLPLLIVLPVMALGDQRSITSFASTYTAVGLAFGAFLRIKKHYQQRSDTRRMQSMLDRLDEATNKLIAHATGGSSRPLFILEPVIPLAQPPQQWLSLWTEGPFPLQQVHGHLSRMETIQSGRVLREIKPIDFVHRNSPIKLITISKADEPLHLHCLLAALNGRFDIRLVIVWSGDNPLMAQAIKKYDDNSETYDVDRGFPGYDPENPESVFSFGEHQQRQL